MAENTTGKKSSTQPAKQATTKRSAAPAKAVATLKAKKRDSVKTVCGLAMPQAEYVKLVELKQVCIKAGIPVKKKELLRAGLHALGNLSVPKLKQVLSQVVQIKAGHLQQKAPRSALSE